MNQAIKDSCSGPGDAERGKIEQRPAVPFVSEATYDSTEKDKRKYIEITCRHSRADKDTKKKNYNVHVRIFDRATQGLHICEYVMNISSVLVSVIDRVAAKFQL